ncbi:MAG: hypothetical protein JW822_05930 [Spirochaetales bacterium]|nr:hypothetical protein [Spirochaetales bacterium]
MHVKKQDLLQKAKDHCFFMGVNDSGAELCKANAVYGIAGIHFVQDRLGIPSNATFIATPDMTITRNTARWTSGFGYGGKISWGQGDEELIVLNVKPNACGMLVGGLDTLPDSKTLIRKIHDMEAATIKIDGTKVNWDFYKSNHFIDIFIVKPTTRVHLKFKKYAFIIHGSAPEFRSDRGSDFGLYYDQSSTLFNMAEHIKTPFQIMHILTGSNAKKYYKQVKYVENFAKRKRRMAAQLLFGEFTEISNENHQSLINMNEILLGCHYMKNKNTIFPLALRGDLPAYLVKAVPNLDPEIIDHLGFEKRARKLGIYDRLIQANILPHGGGYVLPDILTVNKVIEIEGKRYFEVEMLNDRGKKIISEVKELPYEYRGRKVVLRAMELGIIKIVAKLIPQYILKI